MTTRTKISVYALENYVIAASASTNNEDQQGVHNDINSIDKNNRKARNKKGDVISVDTKDGTNNRSKSSAKNKRGQEAQEDEEKHMLTHCKTPLEKLISLKIRYTRQNSCVLSVDGVLLVHAHRHTHILLLKQHVQKRKNVLNSAHINGSNTTTTTNTSISKSDGHSALAREAANATGLSNFSTASSIANVQSDVVFRLPGGRCRRGESEENCLIRKLGRLLLNEAKLPSASNINDSTMNTNNNASSAISSTTMMTSKSTTEMTGMMNAGVSAAGHLPDTILDVNAESQKEQESQAASFFHVGELLAKWYRPHFSPLMYPYIPPHISPTSIKEMRSVFLVQAEPMLYFNIMQCMDAELVAVPLFDLYDNSAKYGPVISALPAQLSRILVEYSSVEY